MNIANKITGAAKLQATTSTTRKRKRATKPRKNGTRKQIKNLPGKLKVTKKIIQKNICLLCATYFESESMLVSLHGPYKGVTLCQAMAAIMLVGFNKKCSQVACQKCADKVVAWHEMRERCAENTRILEVAATKFRMGSVNQNRSLILTYHVLMTEPDEETREAASPIHRQFPTVRDPATVGQFTEVIYYGTVRDSSQLLSNN